VNLYSDCKRDGHSSTGLFGVREGVCRRGTAVVHAIISRLTACMLDEFTAGSLTYCHRRHSMLVVLYMTTTL